MLLDRLTALLCRYLTQGLSGGNSGIGKQTVAVLASKGAKVYLAARSEEKYQKVIEEIHASHPNSANGSIEFLKLDLSTATSALAAANDFKMCVFYYPYLFIIYRVIELTSYQERKHSSCLVQQRRHHGHPQRL